MQSNFRSMLLGCLLVWLPLFTLPVSAQEAAPAANASFDVTHLPNDAAAILVFKPKAIQATDLYKLWVLTNLSKLEPEQTEQVLKCVDSIDQMTMIGMKKEGTSFSLIDPWFIIQFSDAKGIQELKQLPNFEAWSSRLVTLNETTLFLSANGSKKSLEHFHRLPKGSPAIVTRAGWKSVNAEVLVFAIDTQGVPFDVSEAPPAGYPLLPILENTSSGFLGMRVREQKIQIKLALQSKQPDKVEVIHKAAQTTLETAIHSLPILEMGFGKEMQTVEAKFGWDTLVTLAKDTQLNMEDNVVVASSSVSSAIPEEVFASLKRQQSEALLRETVQSNFQSISSALERHHESLGHFPSSADAGNDKPLHSWRVAILPFLGESERELHKLYHFDEPWDSENNKQLLAKMPQVFRHPLDKAVSVNSCYFALTSKKDTFAIAEAKRDIPWTKPEDITFNPDQPSPELGGWTPEGWWLCRFDFGKPGVDLGVFGSTGLPKVLTMPNPEFVESETKPDKVHRMLQKATGLKAAKKATK